MKLSLWGKNL